LRNPEERFVFCQASIACTMDLAPEVMPPGCPWTPLLAIFPIYAASMQISASGQSDQFGQHKYIYSMFFISGKGFMHGAVNEDRHVHISGHDL
jgi:hypothetical protein